MGYERLLGKRPYQANAQYVDATHSIKTPKLYYSMLLMTYRGNPLTNFSEILRYRGCSKRWRPVVYTTSHRKQTGLNDGEREIQIIYDYITESTLAYERSRWAIMSVRLVRMLKTELFRALLRKRAFYDWWSFHSIRYCHTPYFHFAPLFTTYCECRGLTRMDSRLLAVSKL